MWPRSRGWGAEEETRATLIWVRAARVYHSPTQTKNEHLMTSRMRLRGLVLLLGLDVTIYSGPSMRVVWPQPPMLEARRWGHARVPQATLITTMPGSAKNIYGRYWMSKWGGPDLGELGGGDKVGANLLRGRATFTPRSCQDQGRFVAEGAFPQATPFAPAPATAHQSIRPVTVVPLAALAVATHGRPRLKMNI
jgi:hypothetical protein